MNTLPHSSVPCLRADGIVYRLKSRVRRPRRANRFVVSLLLFAAGILSSSAAEYVWTAAGRDGTRELEAAQDGSAKASAHMPGNLRIYRSAKRETLAPDRAVFQAGTLSFQLKLTGCATPVKAWIFAKDKEGNWFQSEREYAVLPGTETVLELPLDEPGAMLPVGPLCA